MSTLGSRRRCRPHPWRLTRFVIVQILSWDGRYIRDISSAIVPLALIQVMQVGVRRPSCHQLLVLLVPRRRASAGGHSPIAIGPIRTIIPFLLALGLMGLGEVLRLREGMAYGRNISSRALDGALGHLSLTLVKVGDKREFSLGNITATTVAHAWCLKGRRVRRIKPRRMSRLTLLVTTASSIASSILLIQLQSRQGTGDIIDRACWNAATGGHLCAPVITYTYTSRSPW